MNLPYLAGILDVSGSLHVYRRTDGRGRITLQITSEHLAIPQAFAEVFGGKIGIAKKRHRWTKYGKSAQACLKQLRPYMRVKTKLVDELLATSTKRRGRPEKPKNVKPPVLPDICRTGNSWVAGLTGEAGHGN